LLAAAAAQAQHESAETEIPVVEGCDPRRVDPEKFNALASTAKSLNATVECSRRGGLQVQRPDSGVSPGKAFLLASRPANIRMIGQAPVISKTIFDMTSDGATFRVSLPTKNSFLLAT